MQLDAIDLLTRAADAGGGTLEDASSLAPLPTARLAERVLETSGDEAAALRVLAEGLHLGWAASPEVAPDDLELVRSALPARMAAAHRVLPLREEDGALLVASSNPFDLVARQQVVTFLGREVRWVLAPLSKILAGIQEVYGVGADTFEEILSAKGGQLDHGHEGKDEASVLDADDDEAAAIRFVNQIIRGALSQRATDIHLEPLEESLRIRYRVDGVLKEVPVPQHIKQLQPMVIARLKVMAKLDIAERRLPQDGRIHLQNEGEPIDVRVATIPSVEGESISLRLLGRERFSLERLGLPDGMLQEVETLLEKPNGIILVTGPTGCGKSTSLYTFLSRLNSEERRIVTIEDPVEHKLPGVVQIAVKPEIDLTFAGGLRSVLRGDPNVIMVGEIRDLETAEIAIRAALTGHLVFSTLHTNDALGGITRLADMGVEPFLIGSSLRAFIAQRLVRELCADCRLPHPHPESAATIIGLPLDPGATLFTASPGGCEHCGGTGYLGRIAIYEIVKMDAALGEAINHQARKADLLQLAENNGYRTMRAYGWDKVMAGETTVEEVLAATASDD